MTPLFTLESWFASVHPDDRARVLEGLERGEANVTEVRVELAPGHYVPLRSARQPVRDERGEPVEWLGLTTIVEPGHGGLEADDAASEELLNGPLLRAARNLLGWTTRTRRPRMLRYRKSPGERRSGRSIGRKSPTGRDGGWQSSHR